ncbi:hypothetical protein D3C72_2130520 [compost metagenome]
MVGVRQVGGAPLGGEVVVDRGDDRDAHRGGAQHPLGLGVVVDQVELRGLGEAPGGVLGLEGQVLLLGVVAEGGEGPRVQGAQLGLGA